MFIFLYHLYIYGVAYVRLRTYVYVHTVLHTMLHMHMYICRCAYMMYVCMYTHVCNMYITYVHVYRYMHLCYVMLELAVGVGILKCKYDIIKMLTQRYTYHFSKRFYYT